jgi:hypothetical protein
MAWIWAVVKKEKGAGFNGRGGEVGLKLKMANG